MALAASVILNRAATTLLDSGNVNWTAPELLDYLNSGINAIVANKPDVYILSPTVNLVAGTPKQTLPSDGLQLINIIRNSNPPYTAVRQIDQNHLNHTDPNWAGTLGTTIQHFFYDKRNPLTYWVYPTPASILQLDIVYSAVPPRLVSSGAALPLSDIYENPLHNFILAYAYAKNAKRGDLGKTQAYLALFSQQIGAREQVQFQFSPITPDESSNEKQAGAGSRTTIMGVTE